MVKVGSRLVEGQDTAISAERFCKGEPDYEGGQDLLPCAASAAHVQLRVIKRDDVSAGAGGRR